MQVAKGCPKGQGRMERKRNRKTSRKMKGWNTHEGDRLRQRTRLRREREGGRV